MARNWNEEDEMYEDDLTIFYHDDDELEDYLDEDGFDLAAYVHDQDSFNPMFY